MRIRFGLVSIVAVLATAACEEAGQVSSPTSPSPLTSTELTPTVTSSETAMWPGTEVFGGAPDIDEIPEFLPGSEQLSVEALGVLVAKRSSDSQPTPSLHGRSVQSEDASPTARVALKRLKVKSADNSLRVGDTTTVTAEAHYDDGSKEMVTPTWSSRNPTVATVSETGKVTAIAVGTVRIRASYGGKNPSVKITVAAAVQVQRLEISAKKRKLSVGQSTTVKAVAYYPDGSKEDVTPSWSSTKPAVATVSAVGKVTAVSEGTTRIRAQYGGKRPTLKITVGAAAKVTRLTLTAGASSIRVGQSTTVSAMAHYSDGTKKQVTPNWSSANPGVATVSAVGRVKGIAVGTARIRASYEGKNPSIRITIKPEGPKRRFGPGQHLVGIDIAAARYFSSPSYGCYWERQRGLGGTLSDIIANDFIGYNAGQWIVDVRASDKAFEADSDCGTWNTSRRGGTRTTIRQGLWLVGKQIRPGTYRANVSYGCYWSRRRNFTGRISGIISNDFVSSGGIKYVTIKASDAGFETDDDCGTWTRISGVVAAPNDSRAQSSVDIENNRSMYWNAMGFVPR